MAALMMLLPAKSYCWGEDNTCRHECAAWNFEIGERFPYARHTCGAVTVVTRCLIGFDYLTSRTLHCWYSKACSRSNNKTSQQLFLSLLTTSVCGKRTRLYRLFSKLGWGAIRLYLCFPSCIRAMVHQLHPRYTFLTMFCPGKTE